MEVPGPAPAPADAASRAGSLTDDPRKWWALSVLLLAQLMIILDIAIVNVAIPSAQQDLHIAQADVQWVVTSYLLPFGGLLLLGGRIADFTGRKRVFCVATLGFAFASGLGGAASSEGILFAARALQGTFAAAMAPSLLSMLTLGFPRGPDRARAFSFYGGVGAAGAGMGLVLGGVLTEYLSWRWSFFINIPLSVVVLAGAIPLLRESRAAGSTRYDVAGAALGTIGLLGIVYGIATAADEGWGSPEVLVPLFAGVAIVAAFVAWEAGVRDPLMPLGIFADRNRAGGFVSFFVVYGPPSAWLLLLLIYLQGPRDLSPAVAGVSFLPGPIAAIACAAVSIKLLERVSPRLMISVGSLMAGAAMLWATRIGEDSSYAADILPGLVLMGAGTAMAYIAANTVALHGIPERDTGVTSAVINTIQQVGAALGVAILTTVAASAAEDYLLENGPDAQGAAIIHGNEEAFLLGALMMLGAGALSIALIRGSRLTSLAPDAAPLIQGAADSTRDTNAVAPAVWASAKGKQRADKAIKVKLRCDRACTVEATGSAPGRKRSYELKPVTVRLAAGESATLKLRPKGKKARRKVKRAGKGRAEVELHIKDAPGNLRTESLTVKLTRK